MGNPDSGPLGETRWLSYAELARSREISKRAAIRLSNRCHWRRQAGEDGVIRVAVPDSERGPRQADPIQRMALFVAANPEQAAAGDARVRRLEAELETARMKITDLLLREAMARTRVEALEAQISRLNLSARARIAAYFAGLSNRVLPRRSRRSA